MTDHLPHTRDDVYGLPPGVKELYEYNDHRDEYRLTAGGMVLSNVRSALQDGPIGKININTEVDLNDWMLAVGVATIPERKELLKLAASGGVKIRR